MNDNPLIKACAANDRKAQFALYQKHFAFVSGICLRYLKHEGLARETTNDIFLKAFTKIKLFDARKGAFTTWLRTVAVRTCIDKLKLQSFENLSQPLTEENTATEIAHETLQTTADVLKILQAIPEKQSTIFNLFVVEGYSHDEIGKMLGISPGNSRWYLSDAKQKIKKIMIETGYQVQ